MNRRTAKPGILAVTLGAAVVAALLSSPLSAREPMTRKQIIDIAKTSENNGYQWGGSTWSTDPAKQGKCDEAQDKIPDHIMYGGVKHGSDCSGFVANVWGLPDPRGTEEPLHPFDTGAFASSSGSGWQIINLDELIQGDAIIRPRGETQSGHIVLFDKWKTGHSVAKSYEAMGCKWGMGYKNRTLKSGETWRGLRRLDVIEKIDCTPTTCNGHGECSDSGCECDIGYAGDLCDRCVTGFVGYPTCHEPDMVCEPAGVLRCGGRFGLDFTDAKSSLADYSCGLDGGGKELVYRLGVRGRGKAHIEVDSGAQLAVLRGTCHQDACAAKGTGSVDYEYADGEQVFVSVESGGANNVVISVDCDTGPVWIGDPCNDDADCSSMKKADGTPVAGSCYDTDGSGGFCTSECASNGCPDLVGKAPTSCIAHPENDAVGMCVTTSSDVNRQCRDVAGTTASSLPKFNNPNRIAEVCAPASLTAPCGGELLGQVLDQETRMGINFAGVAVPGRVNFTDEEGAYAMPQLTCGEHVLDVSADGYIGTQISVNVTPDTQQLPTVFLSPDADCADNDAIDLWVFDGFSNDGVPVAGATVELRAGVNTYAGAPLATQQTSADGVVRFTGLVPGNYTARVQADGFEVGGITINSCQSLPAELGMTLDKQDALMRVQLTWEQPKDLDLHVQLPNGREVYYLRECRGESIFYPHVTLDVDHTTAPGPEVLTVYSWMPGTYTFFVHNFSHQVQAVTPGEGEDPKDHDISLTKSQATVVVLDGADSEIGRFNVPTSGSGYFWDVFSVDANDPKVLKPGAGLRDRPNPDTDYGDATCRPE